MRPLVVLIASLLLGALLAGCTQPGDTEVGPRQALIETTHGDILIEFFCDEAPQTVANFHQYAEDGFYEGTIFHRIIETFMIQGGGFTEDGQQKQTRAPVPLEYNVPNERGNVAMARTGDPNSATSQFFINTVDNSPNLGPGGVDQYGYTVFARVVEGMDVVDEIASVPTGTGPMGMQNWPNDPPTITAVHVGAPCEEAEPVVPVPKDFIPLWVMNTDEVQHTFDIILEAPEGWDVSLESSSATLGPGGSQGDAHATFLTLQNVTADGESRILVHAVAQDFPEVNATLEILPVAEYTQTQWVRPSENDAGVQVGLMTATMREDGVWEAMVTMEGVSEPGSRVELSYTGSFDNGEVFDSGSFPTTVRSGQTVPGFDTGLLGIAVDETVNLRFPPDLGYGYNPPGHMQQFAGQWLNFEVTIQSLS
jgi:peptidyl-prolyl cis-trans isomerase A (cyclophilin A)